VPGGRFGAIDLRPARLAAGEDGDFPTERPAGYAPPAPLTALKAPETGTPAAIYAALAAVGTGLAGVMGMLISLFAGHPDNAVAAWTVGSIVSFSAAALGFAVGKGPRIYPPLAGASALILAGGAATLALYGAFVLAAGLAIAAAALAAAGVINAGGIRGVLKGLRHAFAEPEPLRAPTAPEKGSGASIVMSSLGMGMAFANAIVAVSYAALGAGALPIIGHAVAAGAILLYSISEFARWRRDQVSSALDEVRHAFADPEPTRDPGPDVSDFPGSRGRWYI